MLKNKADSERQVSHAFVHMWNYENKRFYEARRGILRKRKEMEAM